MKRLIVLLVLSVAVSVLGQLEPPVVPGHNETCNCPNAPFRMATYNTQLVFDAPNRLERARAHISLLNAANFDVVCLQELWDTQFVDMFRNDLENVYPTVFTAPPIVQDCVGGCSTDDLGRVRNCFNQNLCNQSSDPRGCLGNNCEDILEDLPVQCRNCLNFNANFTSDVSLSDSGPCSSNATGPVNATNCQYLFAGYSDTMLLSKHSFNSTEVLYYSTSPDVAWTALYGKLLIDDTLIHVFCTHLVDDSIVSNTSDDAIVQANQQQTQELLSWASAHWSTDYEGAVDQVAYILGDFGSGPSQGDNLQGRNVGTYNMFGDEGWYDLVPVFVQPNNSWPCTQCNDEDEMLDHVFFATSETFSLVDTCVSNATVFASNVTVLVNNQTVTLSDHQGVQASTCLAANAPENALVLPTYMVVEQPQQQPEEEDSAAAIQLSIVAMLVALASTFIL